MPKIDRLLSLFHYNPIEGTITYIRHTSRQRPGDPAGRTKRKTHVITVDGVDYRAIEIAFALYHKRDPSPLHVSPVNGDLNDLRLCNLQLTTERYIPPPVRAKRCATKPPWYRNEIKYSGHTGLWTAKFKIPGTYKHLTVGSFVTKHEAIVARRAFARDYVKPPEESNA